MLVSQVVVEEVDDSTVVSHVVVELVEEYVELTQKVVLDVDE